MGYIEDIGIRIIHTNRRTFLVGHFEQSYCLLLLKAILVLMLFEWVQNTYRLALCRVLSCCSHGTNLQMRKSMACLWPCLNALCITCCTGFHCQIVRLPIALPRSCRCPGNLTWLGNISRSLILCIYFDFVQP